MLPIEKSNIALNMNLGVGVAKTLPITNLCMVENSKLFYIQVKRLAQHFKSWNKLCEHYILL